MILQNNAKPEVLHKSNDEKSAFMKALQIPTDEKGFEVMLNPKARARVDLIQELASKVKLGEPIEIPVDVDPFVCGYPIMVADKVTGKPKYDMSELRKYPGIPMGKTLEFENVQDGIDTIERLSFLDEVEEMDVPILDAEKKDTGKTKKEYVVVKKGREGVKYANLLPTQETEALLKAAQAKHDQQIRDAKARGEGAG